MRIRRGEERGGCTYEHIPPKCTCSSRAYLHQHIFIYLHTYIYAFQERNNQFVDSIFERINRIMAKSYDPFVVMLSNGNPPSKDNKHASTTVAPVAQANKNKNTKTKSKDKAKTTTTKTPVIHKESPLPPKKL